MKAIEPLDLHEDCAGGVRLVPEDDWIQAEITGRRSTLFYGARIEFTLRGQLLRDKCGQMLDARPLDIDSCARCQARPGDDFVTVFRVAPKAGSEDHDAYPWDDEANDHPKRSNKKSEEKKPPDDEKPSNDKSSETE